MDFRNMTVSTYKLFFPEEDSKALKRVYNINNDDSLETIIRKMF